MDFTIQVTVVGFVHHQWTARVKVVESVFVGHCDGQMWWSSLNSHFTSTHNIIPNNQHRSPARLKTSKLKALGVPYNDRARGALRSPCGRGKYRQSIF